MTMATDWENKLIIAGVVVTGDKLIAGVMESMRIWDNAYSRRQRHWQYFIAGVVDTDNKKNCESPRILSKKSKRPEWDTLGTGETDSWRKPLVENLISDSL